jgi:hypothetical protein
MKNKSLLKDFYTLMPFVLGGLVCIGLVVILYDKVVKNPNFITTLESISFVFMAISGFLAIFLMAYLVFSSLTIKNRKSAVINNLEVVTQQMHTARRIIEILLKSNLWLPGLKEYVDHEFSGLTYFDVKEFYKGKSKLAIEFLQDNNHFGDTETLYLELKSLLMTRAKEKRLSRKLVFPNVYGKDIVLKWIEHKCGSGLLYYFGYKFGAFKDMLRLNEVSEVQQEQVMKLALEIDKEHFEDSSFNENFLAKFGDYITKNIIPQLFQLYNKASTGFTPVMKYVYTLFVLLVIFGLVVPILYLLFSLSVLFLIISYGMVISIIFFITTTFYAFLTKEINS